MIRIIDIIVWIMGIRKPFIELHNSIIIRNRDNPAMEFYHSIMENHDWIMKIHKSVTFRKLHNSKLWSSIIRIMELHKRFSSSAQPRTLTHTPTHPSIIDKRGKFLKNRG